MTAATTINGLGDPLVATPAYLLDQIDRLGTEITSANVEIQRQYNAHCQAAASSACDELWQFFTAEWVPFGNDWNRFKDAHQSWYERLWGALDSEIKAYRARFVALYKAAQMLGVKFAGPAPESPTGSRTRDALLVAGGAILGLVLMRVLR